MTTGIWNWLGWFLFGNVVGGGIMTLWFSMKDKITFRWYEYLLTSLAVLILGFMMQTFWSSFQEFEAQAAWMSIIFMGIPFIIIAVIIVRSVQQRLPKA